ncbi:MAG: hypothetical protein GF401_05175 [Chitinivibrionales bacterium]|nr:hypothetical protein [Chitinivibrionales bacterium]
MKVFVSCKLEKQGLDKLESHPDIEVLSIPRPSNEELIDSIADSDAVIIKSNVKLSADILEKAGKLSIICRAGAGVDNIDIRKATERGIPVTNTPGLNSNSVAELVFSYIHNLYKNIARYDLTTKNGGWEKGTFVINELRGKCIGIAGLGAIGRRVLEKAKGYHMNIRVFDPFVSQTMARDLGVELIPEISGLFRSCDIVTLHMPSTAETKGSITSDILASMKENAIFINTARGTLLADNALEDAMMEHATLRAGIDVYHSERAGEKALARFGDRVIMTPHIAGNSSEGQVEIAECAADMVIDALTKNKLRNLVNFVTIPEELDLAYLDLAEHLGLTAASFTEHKGQLEEIRITCYGKLNQFTEILVKPAIQGALSLFLDEDITMINAEKKARDQGVNIVLRSPDNTKGYSQSITVDTVVRREHFSAETSVRGKLIEGEPAIIRIDDYHELGITPTASQTFFIYDNKPGVIGAIATMLGKEKINIANILARQDVREARKQLLAVSTCQPVSQDLTRKIAQRAEDIAGVKMYEGIVVEYGG